MPDRLRNFLGKRPIIFNGVELYSPTVDSIDEIGEIKYYIYLALATFNKEQVLKILFGLNDEDFLGVENYDGYLLLTSMPELIDELCNALSFFVKDEVEYDKEQNAFSVKGKIFLGYGNYFEFVKIIEKQNGIFESNVKNVEFKNKKAKEMYKKLLKFREKSRKVNSNDNLELKDLLSILCSAEGNGINIFNVGQLTVYQVYEHFERLNIKEQHTRLLRVWANGYLDKNTKLPEWIVKSKL